MRNLLTHHNGLPHLAHLERWPISKLDAFDNPFVRRPDACCVQMDANAWPANGPTTRHAIRTFFVRAVKNRTCTNITVGHRRAGTSGSPFLNHSWVPRLVVVVPIHRG